METEIEDEIQNIHVTSKTLGKEANGTDALGLIGIQWDGWYK